MGAGSIDENIVYSRFGVPIISLITLSDYLIEGVPPFIFAAPGGLYVRLIATYYARSGREEYIIRNIGRDRWSVQAYDQCMRTEWAQ